MPRKSQPAQPYHRFTVNFVGRLETLEDVFGKDSMPLSHMTERLWNFIRDKDLLHEKKPTKRKASR